MIEQGENTGASSFSSLMCSQSLQLGGPGVPQLHLPTPPQGSLLHLLLAGASQDAHLPAGRDGGGRQLLPGLKEVAGKIWEWSGLLGVIGGHHISSLLKHLCLCQGSQGCPGCSAACPGEQVLFGKEGSRGSDLLDRGAEHWFQGWQETARVRHGSLRFMPCPLHPLTVHHICCMPSFHSVPA